MTATLSMHAQKARREWQDALWAKWPLPAQWPGVLDLYEAAAFLRVHPDTIRRALVRGRDGKARLAHRRLGTSIRIGKADIEGLGNVKERKAS